MISRRWYEVCTAVRVLRFLSRIGDRGLRFHDALQEYEAMKTRSVELGTRSTRFPCSSFAGVIFLVKPMLIMKNKRVPKRREGVVKTK